MKFRNLCLWCLVVVINLQGSLALRDVSLAAPGAVARGQPVRMSCLYDLEREELYTVKWYRDDLEFCNYSPRNVPPLKVFPISGIDVVEEESDAFRLTLAGASPATTGRFVCEVSVDAPSFQTARVDTLLKLIDPPPSGPEIEVPRPRYRAGDRLKAECASRDAQPPANLSFYVNGEPAPAQHVWQRVELSRDQLMSSFSTISFTVQPHHFVNNRLKLRCKANVYDAYVKTSERILMEEPLRRRRPTTAPHVLRAVVLYPTPPSTPTNGAVRLQRSLRRLLMLFLLAEVLK